MVNIDIKCVIDSLFSKPSFYFLYFYNFILPSMFGYVLYVLLSAPTSGSHWFLVGEGNGDREFVYVPFSKNRGLHNNVPVVVVKYSSYNCHSLPPSLCAKVRWILALSPCSYNLCLLRKRQMKGTLTPSQPVIHYINKKSLGLLLS